MVPLGQKIMAAINYEPLRCHGLQILQEVIIIEKREREREREDMK
jgi:hypothetical protein